MDQSQSSKYKRMESMKPRESKNKNDRPLIFLLSTYAINKTYIFEYFKDIALGLSKLMIVIRFKIHNNGIYKTLHIGNKESLSSGHSIVNTYVSIETSIFKYSKDNGLRLFIVLNVIISDRAFND